MNALLKKSGLFLLAAGLLLISGQVSAESVTGYPDMYSKLPGEGSVNHTDSVDRALRILEKNQLVRERRDVTITGPRDVHIINHRFISISFNATIKKKGHARQKAVPAVFALLFEKNRANELTFYKSIYLAWVGAKDIEEYKAISLAKVCAYYREKGAEYVVPELPSKKKKKVKKEVVTLNASDIKSGVLKESYIDSAITRDAELQTILTGYQKKDDVQQAPDADQKVLQLEARIKRLEALLANVTRKGNNIYFQKVNLHLVNGTGKTEQKNGAGNLIVGYGSKGNGSHNVVVGSNNQYSSVGSIVTGTNNQTGGNYSAVTGGKGNTASGEYAVIAGGANNDASGDYSSILGGSDNKSKGKYTSINGQRGRTKVDAGKNKHFKN